MALQRIVKMTFRPEHCQDFELFFEEIKDQVGNQPGCSGVKLLRDLSGSGVFFTYSEWKDQASLDQYRTTELFKLVWPRVKAWFASPAEAWSTEIKTQSSTI